MRKTSDKIHEKIAKLYFRQILEAMNHCHQRGICHRDLKPENILIDDENNVKVIDFGFSASSNDKLNSHCGTPPFMAPEITKKGLYNGRQTDIWALGVLLYLMLVGKFPFRATSEP